MITSGGSIATEERKEVLSLQRVLKKPDSPPGLLAFMVLALPVANKVKLYCYEYKQHSESKESL